MAGRLAAALTRLSLTTTASTSGLLAARPAFHPSTRLVRTAIRLEKSIRDVHGAGTRIRPADQEVLHGLVGGSRVMVVATSSWEAQLPTPDTLKQEFNGIVYTELPKVYIKATKNNTLINAIDHKGRVIMYTSCRLEGFKNARKKTSIAGQTTGVAAGQKLVRRGIRTVRVEVKGIGPGRMTSVKGLAVAGVNVVSITDHTNLIEMGPRPKKIRRI